MNSGDALRIAFDKKWSLQPSGCWLWTGNMGGGDYGIIKVCNRQRKAHRASWELHYGPIPAGQKVLHKCARGGCVNPAHLYLGHLDQAHRRARRPALTAVELLSIVMDHRAVREVAAAHNLAIRSVFAIRRRFRDFAIERAA